MTEGAAERPREVFLSHASADRRFVSRTADVLRRHGVAAWFSAAHLRGAQEWHLEIGRALARCDWFVVVLSPASVGSKWVQRELVYALVDERYDGRVVPVLYKGCDPARLSWTLRGVQRVDFVKSIESGYRDLLRVWGIEYERGGGGEAQRGRR